MRQELIELLEAKADEFNCAAFIPHDPISVPHLFQKKQDIEIAAFLTCTLAWGQRKTIIHNAKDLMKRMDFRPHEFVLNFTKRDQKFLTGFVHRTFSTSDLVDFISLMQRLYQTHNTLENIFAVNLQLPGDACNAIGSFRDEFFLGRHATHCEKHISDPRGGSAAKRINLFLRWMVRKDQRGVDFGLWSKIPMSALSIPLDLHSGNIARRLGLLSRNQNDWKAVMELDSCLRSIHSADPVKYDFALFGLGVFEKSGGIML
ncbi:MAG: TIGR02757 family protein [Flavobacteriales bacterium]